MTSCCTSFDSSFVSVTKGLPNDPVWVPCDVDVAADGSVTLVGGPVSHAEPQLAQERME